MNANNIIDDNMSLAETLAAIEAAMGTAQQQSDKKRATQGLPPIPIDPADALMCEGCQ